MDVSTLKCPELVSSVGNLLFGLKVASESLSAVWDSVSFTEARASSGGEDIKGGKLALNKLSLACTELAKCGDLSKGWQNRSLKQLVEELSGSQRMIEYGSLEALSKQVQVHLDRLAPRSVAGLTGRRLVPEGETTMASALEGLAISAEDSIRESPEERWNDLRKGFKRIGNPRCDQFIGLELDPFQGAGMWLLSFAWLKPGVSTLDEPTLPDLKSWWIDHIYNPLEPVFAGLSISKQALAGASLPSVEGLTFLQSREGKEWSANLMTCLWELLDEKHFPGLRTAYQDAVSTGNWMEWFKKCNELPCQMQKALAERNRPRAREMIDSSYRFEEEDFSLALELRAAVVFDEQCKALQFLRKANQVLDEERIPTLADFSDDRASTVEPLAKKLLDKGVVRPGYEVEDVVPMSRSIAECILGLTSDRRPDRETSVGIWTPNFVAKLKLLSDMQGIFKDWPAELITGRQLESNWTAIFCDRVAMPMLEAMRTYNQQFYEKGCEPMTLWSDNVEEGMQLGAAIQLDPHGWFTKYVNEMRARLGIPPS